MGRVNRVVVIGGGPGGYEAALVAAQLGADVTVVDTDGIGGSAVLTDCVPSKTLIATAELMADMEEADELGLMIDTPGAGRDALSVDLAKVNTRVKELALAQSADIERRLTRDGVRVLRGRGRLDTPAAPGQAVWKVVAELADGGEETLEADAVLVATGASPRTLDTAQPDGERILSWDQVYDLDEVPEKLVVVGSGVTGAEFAGAYNALGIDPRRLTWPRTIDMNDRALRDAVIGLGGVANGVPREERWALRAGPSCECVARRKQAGVKEPIHDICGGVAGLAKRPADLRQRFKFVLAQLRPSGKIVDRAKCFPRPLRHYAYRRRRGDPRDVVQTNAYTLIRLHTAAQVRNRQHG